jgi:3-isopropylmalate/(R)-2-methylmalate dehydratase large subunit
MLLPERISLTPGKRVLFLTKDRALLEKQLYEGLDLKMSDLKVEDLLDDINTDAMTPAWVCFNYRPAEIAKNAYAGLAMGGERVFKQNALANGNFEVIASGFRKGVGSSRETAAQAEVWCGIKIAVAASFAPIHARNNINLGSLMCDHATLERLQSGESIAWDHFANDYDNVTKLIVQHGGLFPFSGALKAGKVKLPTSTTPKRAMNIAEKLISQHLVSGAGAPVKPGDPVMVKVDGGYSHEFTTAQVHHFLQEEYGPDYKLPNAANFAVFEDHLIYADGVERMKPHAGLIQELRDHQRAFQKHTNVRDFSAQDGVSPGICHQVAREQWLEPGQFIQATDSHTCMGGASNALAYGVGATEYAALIHSGFTLVEVPQSIRFELTGKLRDGVAAKDLILYILANHAKRGETLDRVMEWGGPGVATLSVDERATLANMATECTAKTGIFEGDQQLVDWMRAHRPSANGSLDGVSKRFVSPDPGAEYAAVYKIDLATIEPMVATPGDPTKGILSDPTNGALIKGLGSVHVDIAYGGSCTAGKDDDIEMYARVIGEAVKSGKKVAEGTTMYLQFGSREVRDRAKAKGYVDLFKQAGVQIIEPGCGACIGCGPGVSDNKGQVSVSAINRNFEGRSGPGRLYLASPLTVAASAIRGEITAYEPGMFAG